jgi:hypothetical protein
MITVCLSCSNQPTTFKLTVNHAPVGKVIEYKLESHRVGSAYKNDELVEDFDVKVEGDIIYTTQKMLGGGDAIVLEENVWSWDEPVDDSGQVKRITKDYAYKFQISSTGKVTDLKMLGKSSQVWEDYVREYTNQGMPNFPDQKISAGHSWTQTASVTLPDSEVVEVSTQYTIKGTASKDGYECAIIEYKGNLVLPIFPDPVDSLSPTGVDRIELNGILYFSIEAGMAVNSEERRRVVTERSFTKEGKPIERRSEFEAVISYNLISIGAG